MLSALFASALAVQAVPVIPLDWAAEKGPAAGGNSQLIRQAVRETLQEQSASEPPRRHEADTLRGDKYDQFAADFAEARVPDCLRSQGLKRQPTFFLSGILAIPFVAVAKLRGKCN